MNAKKMIERIRMLQVRRDKHALINIEERKKLRHLLKSTLKFNRSGIAKVGPWVIKKLEKTRCKEKRIQIFSSKTFSFQNAVRRAGNRKFFARPKSSGS